mgnify:CR=1 FL=1
MKCKLTDKEIKPFMSFGKMPLANGFLSENEFKTEFFFNMEVGFSKKLSLFQLNEHPSPKKMFNKKYPFFSGSSELMKLHFKKYATWVKKEFLKSDSKLIEIGSNDGTFLENFKNSNIDYIGFEPSENVAMKAKGNNIKMVNDFFNLENIYSLKNFKKNTDAICASNVICHMPDLKNLILSIDELLKSEPEKRLKYDVAFQSALGDWTKCLVAEDRNAAVNIIKLAQSHKIGNLSILFPEYDAADLLAILQPNLAASTGAACTSGITEPSHVLRALELSGDLADHVIRFSFGQFLSEDDIMRGVKLLKDAVERIQIR